VNLIAPVTASEKASYGSQKEQREFDHRRNDLISRSHAHLRAAFRAIHPSRPTAYLAILKYADMILSAYLVSPFSIPLLLLLLMLLTLLDSRPPLRKMESISMQPLDLLDNFRKLTSLSSKSFSHLTIGTPVSPLLPLSLSSLSLSYAHRFLGAVGQKIR
jgi:hypothetical protein